MTLGIMCHFRWFGIVSAPAIAQIARNCSDLSQFPQKLPPVKISWSVQTSKISIISSISSGMQKIKKTHYFFNAHIWFFKKEIQHGSLHFGWYFQLVNIFHFFHVLHVLQTYSWFSHPGWQDGAILEPWNTKTFRTVKCFYRVIKVSPLDVREAVKNVLADFVR